jgi:hypothetical protein
MISLFALLAAGCAGSSAAVDSAIGLSPPASVLAVDHVTPLSMVPVAGVAPDQTVLITNGQITAVGPSRRIRVPDVATRIDGHNRYVLPGLADIANTRRIAAVLIGGRYLPAADLERRMTDLAAHNQH